MSTVWLEYIGRKADLGNLTRRRRFTPHLNKSPWRMREIVKLESTAGTGYFYTTTRNKKAQGGKLEVMKYDPKIRKHVKFVEKKASK